MKGLEVHTLKRHRSANHEGTTALKLARDEPVSTKIPKPESSQFCVMPQENWVVEAQTQTDIEATVVPKSATSPEDKLDASKSEDAFVNCPNVPNSTTNEDSTTNKGQLRDSSASKPRNPELGSLKHTVD